jgi:hypothetical protein
MTQDIHPNIEQEARRIVQAGQARGILLRLLGGLAIRVHSPSATHRALARSYPDLDFATPGKNAQPAEALFTDLGYEPNKTFNLFNGDARLLFYDPGHSRQIDVFVGGFQMCHRLPITERLALEPLTLPLAELLLTKLQIVQLNEKDIRDICALLLDHALGETDPEMINVARIGQICAADWGLWRTVTLSLSKVQDRLATYALDPQDAATIVDRLDRFRRVLHEMPKSLKWKMRPHIGESPVVRTSGRSQTRLRGDHVGRNTRHVRLPEPDAIT